MGLAVVAIMEGNEWATEMTFYVRISLPSEAVAATIRREVANLDATVPTLDMNTLEDQIDRWPWSDWSPRAARPRSVSAWRWYGGSAVVRMVLNEVLILTGVGVAVASPSAWWLGKLLESQLYGVTPRDPSRWRCRLSSCSR